MYKFKNIKIKNPLSRGCVSCINSLFFSLSEPIFIYEDYIYQRHCCDEHVSNRYYWNTSVDERNVCQETCRAEECDEFQYEPEKF